MARLEYERQIADQLVDHMNAILERDPEAIHVLVRNHAQAIDETLPVVTAPDLKFSFIGLLNGLWQHVRIAYEYDPDQGRIHRFYVRDIPT